MSLNIISFLFYLVLPIVMDLMCPTNIHMLKP